MVKDLSIIVLSYNTKKITRDCLTSLIKNLTDQKKLKTEIIAIDNNSHDDSVSMLKSLASSSLPRNINFKVIVNKTNLGYPKGNNQGIKMATGKYILLLNSDVIIKNVNFQELITYLDKNPSIGVVTAKVVLPSGRIDPASHRGFPTIWNSLCYFLKLEKVFGRIPVLNKIFGGYHLAYLDLNTKHEIDSPSGAFYLARKSILKDLKGFDENFFMYGEDLDLSMRIKRSGYKIIYFPRHEVLHFKYQSGLKSRDPALKKRIRKHFYEAMRIFYKKHYEARHMPLINNLVYFFIDVKKKLS